MPTTLYEDKGWKILREEATLPDGRTTSCTRVYRADAVHILAFPSKDTILLLREYRPFHGAWQWMLPSGLADKESDVTAAAQRELHEIPLREAVKDVLKNRYAKHTPTAYALLRYGVEHGIVP